ncbi:MAG: hypothetical protein A7316_05060 [Candidatus Altiarchaeales archaeon WOR_SM1_86-2]|nr:MAG: hypothetical protein A7316_05060 [Candidatus Altiarchaeales archaeon WOR_SM1_86-2]ODS40463.1 MAG: hypothetical protein A7315_08360 [Candidatus Altiarchaeales archaeon WOR_SM1_79]
MAKKISREVGYINEIRNCFFDLKRREVKKAYDVMKDAECILVYGSGRSFSATLIGISQIARKKRVISPENPGFPGIDRIVESHDNTVFLVASGSGTTPATLNAVEETAAYIDKSNTDKLKVIAITSEPESPVGKIASDYGHIIRLEGRTKVDESLSKADQYLGKGIMGDQFELATLSLCQRITESLYDDASSKSIFERAERQFKVIGKVVDDIVLSRDYEKVLEKIIEPHSVTLGGVNHANLVASMTAIRLAHVKRALGDEVFVCRRENTPQPRVGDLVILISHSGETPSIVTWLNAFDKVGVKILGVSGLGSSTLSNRSDYRFIFKGKKEVMKGSSIIVRGKPSPFYETAAYVLSPLPTHLCMRLYERGYELPEYLLKAMHDITS